MNLKNHYHQLYTNSVAKISAGNYEIDHLIDSDEDYRFGITLLIRPDELVKANIQRFLEEVNKMEPDQYYYQDSDIHITVMAIISCYAGFELKNIKIEDYVNLIEHSLKKHKSFAIECRGLTASPSCILLQGFFADDTLNKIRHDLRLVFKNSTLEQSMDKRYELQTAHSTIIRFKEEFQSTNDFLNVVEKYRDFDFGTFEVKNLDLVFNDWYQRAQFVQKLHVFELFP